MWGSCHLDCFVAGKLVASTPSSYEQNIGADSVAVENYAASSSSRAIFDHLALLKSTWISLLVPTVDFETLAWRFVGTTNRPFSHSMP